jgi:hypothetical protein
MWSSLISWRLRTFVLTGLHRTEIYAHESLILITNRIERPWYVGEKHCILGDACHADDLMRTKESPSE